MSNKRLDEEDILFNAIKKDTENKRIIIRLALIEDDPARLSKLVKGLEMGDKRSFFDELRNFIESDKGLKEEVKEEYKTIMDENEAVYNQIENVVVAKTGKRANFIKHRVDGRRDTIQDFIESNDNIGLRSNLELISGTQRIIQQEAETIVITEQNAEEVLKIFNRIMDTSGNWLRYLKAKSGNGAFDLYDEEYWDLMDETIKENKKTILIVEKRKEEIVRRYPDIAREVEGEQRSNRNEEQRTPQGEENNGGDER